MWSVFVHFFNGKLLHGCLKPHLTVMIHFGDLMRTVPDCHHYQPWLSFKCSEYPSRKNLLVAVDSCRKHKINQNSIIILDNIDTGKRTNWAEIQNHSLCIDPYACFFAGIRIYHKKSPLTKIFKTNKGGRGVNRQLFISTGVNGRLFILTKVLL